MSKTPLTEWRRDKITNAILIHAFEKRSKAHAKAQAPLFIRALRDIHGENTLKRIARLPPEWFPKANYQPVSADGWRVDLHGLKAIAVPHREYVATLSLKDPTLIADVRAWATEGKTIKDGRERLQGQVQSLLRSLRTVEAFLAAMPEAEAILKDLSWVQPAGTSIATTADAVKQAIAAARGEAEQPT